MTLKMTNIYYPSYNRAGKVRAYDYFGCGNIVVPEAQEEEYRKHYGDAVITVPDNKDGSVSKKKNAILELIQEREANGFGFIIDDDLNKIRRKKEGIDLTGEQALELLEKTQIMAQDMGATYGGFDYSEDNMKLKDMAPFSLNKPVYGLILINAGDNIRYDERFRVNEDVEMWVQKMNANRKIMKDNQYAAIFHGDDGGADSVIGYNRYHQRTYATMLNTKWGKKIMEWKGRSFRFTKLIKGA
jgi:hypothetical protein